MKLLDLPKDLFYLISNYDPRIILLLPNSELIKIDWFRLIEMNFYLKYSKDECRKMYEYGNSETMCFRPKNHKGKHHAHSCGGKCRYAWV